MKVKAIIERGMDGIYSVYMDDDNFDFGLNGQGNSVNEAKAEFIAVYEELKDMYKEEGKDIPILEFEYIFDVASFLDYFSNVLSKSGLEKITGVNQKQLWHYAAGKRNPSRETILKIQNGLHKLAEDLSQVQFID